MKRAIMEVASGLRSLATGMRITLGQFFKPSVTVHYPHKALKMPPRFRGHIELVRDPNTGKAVCYACKLCERACPSDCIIVDGAKLDGAKKKSVSQYQLDFTKCSLCGSCVEACRDGAIRFSREYNLASLNKDDYVMDLFKRLENEARESGDAPANTPVVAAAPSTEGAAAPQVNAAAPGNPAPPVAPPPAAAASQPTTPAEVK